jgi:hypothetical protein
VDDLNGSDPAEIAAQVVADPPLIAKLLDAMLGEDEGIRARAAAAAEQAARERPELLAPHADALIEAARIARDGDTRRCVAQMLARVELSDERAAEATDVLESYLAGGPPVETWALSAIVALANEHPALRGRARELVHARADGETAPPVRERARLLLGQADSWPSGAGSA